MNRDTGANRRTPQLRWALLGASWIADTRMIPALHRCSQQVNAVVSSSSHRAASFAAQHQIPFHGTDPTAVLDAAQVDAVYISTTNERHHALATFAASRGLHVLCEKPIADTLPDAADIVRVCATTGIALAVNHHLVAAGTHTKIRQLVADGAIGKILAVRIRNAALLPENLRTWRLSDQPGAGVIPDIASHNASITNAIFHPQLPEEAVAIGVRQAPWRAGSNDAAMAVIRYGNTLVQTHDAFTTPFGFSGIDVLGDAGTIVGDNVLTQDPIGTVRLEDHRGTHDIDVTDREDLYDKVVSAFCLASRNEGRPTVDGTEGLRATAVAAAVEEAARTGSRVQISLSENEPDNLALGNEAH